MKEKIDLSKFRKNVEEMKDSVIGLCKEEEKTKLFKYEDFFGLAKAIPSKKVYFDKEIEYNQGGSSKCTAYAGTVVSNHTQKKDVGLFPMFDPNKVWELQTTKYPKTGSDLRGDYLVAPFQLFQKIGVEGKSPTGQNFLYKIQYYYFINNKSIDTIKDAISRIGPVGTGGRFNREIFNNVKENGFMELMLSDTGASTFGHALAIIGYDENSFYIQDSYKDRGFNVFQVKFEDWLRGCNDGTIFGNVIVPVDISDKDKFSEELNAMLFNDVGLGMKIGEPEIYNAIKWVKENGIFQGSNGNFHPNVPISRKHLALVLDRFYKEIISYREENI